MQTTYYMVMNYTYKLDRLFSVNVNEVNFLDGEPGEFKIKNDNIVFSAIPNQGDDLIQGPVNVEYRSHRKPVEAETQFVFIEAPEDLGKIQYGGLVGNQMKGDRNGSYLLGLKGNDTIDGKAGNDLLDGGEGKDILIGGRGDDMLIGGNGQDTFRVGIGHDTIIDFDLDVDRIVNPNLGKAPLTLAAMQEIAVEQEGGTLLQFDGENSVLLRDFFFV
jgi:Ca2+-binding RTX toxin-like protein